MNEIKKCAVPSGQHSWVALPTKGLGKIQSYSCPMCGQLVYWSNASRIWIKPSTSSNKPIPGNQPQPKTTEGEKNDVRQCRACKAYLSNFCEKCDKAMQS